MSCLSFFRMGFLRKVYGLLSVQLAMTTLVAGVCLFNPAVKGLIHSNPWLIMVAFILSMVLLVALHIKRKEAPLNLILLAAFVSLVQWGLEYQALKYQTLFFKKIIPKYKIIH